MEFLYVLTVVYFVLILILLEAKPSRCKLKKKFFEVNEVHKLFSGFLRKFDKAYNNKTEYTRRLKIFTKNIKFINEKNKENDDMQLGITKFTDMTKREQKEHFSCLAKLSRLSQRDNKDLEEMFEIVKDPIFCGDLPASWDWRDYKIVSPVREQGPCGSCWAFAITGALETLHAIKHNDLYTLSVQQLVDCIPENDCDGGYPHQALQYLAARLDGIAEEHDYPYIKKKDTCNYAIKITDIVVVKSVQYYLSNEDYLKALVRNKGPIILGMQTGPYFTHYSSGIASSAMLGCTPDKDLSHAVLLVGYGEDADGTPYWIMKNSHGPDWGENGYFRMLRGKNTCKILSYVVGAEVR